MNTEITEPQMSAAEQLRPVVITVVMAKLAVFALLMTTINLPVPARMVLEAGHTTSMQVAALR